MGFVPPSAGMGEDRALRERWRDGDRSAGEELFRRYSSEILRFFDGKVGFKAEQLTQQTFIACRDTRDSLSGEASDRIVLFTLAWSQLREHLRGELKDESVDFEVSSLNELSARVGSPSSQMARAHQSQYVHQALAHLPVLQQILLEYCHWHDFEDGALAEIFGVPSETVPDLLSRARKALRNQLTGGAVGTLPTNTSDPLTNSLQQLPSDERDLP
jgi:RNA polymerase sigma factor (sigma-70 family)